LEELAFETCAINDPLLVSIDIQANAGTFQPGGNVICSMNLKEWLTLLYNAESNEDKRKLYISFIGEGENFEIERAFHYYKNFTMLAQAQIQLSDNQFTDLPVVALPLLAYNYSLTNTVSISATAEVRNSDLQVGSQGCVSVSTDLAFHWWWYEMAVLQPIETQVAPLYRYLLTEANEGFLPSREDYLAQDRNTISTPYQCSWFVDSDPDGLEVSTSETKLIIGGSNESGYVTTFDGILVDPTDSKPAK
jgi:hypothetical protein